MKKVLSVLLAIAMLAVMVTVPVSASSDILTVGEYATCFGCWDNIYRDEDLISGAGNAYNYAMEYDRMIGGPASNLTITGWYAADQAVVKYGYVIDNGEPVLSEDFVVKAEDTVVNAAASRGCAFAARYKIPIDVSGITGTVMIRYLAQFEDGTVVEVGVPGQEVWFNYSGDGSGVPTEAPTAEPGSDAADPNPGFIMVFDADEKYEDFFSTYAEVDSVEFDPERGCMVFKFGTVVDPSVTLPFSKLFAYDLDDIYADDYPVIQFGAKLDHTICDNGQFYFQTADHGTYDEAKDVHFSFNGTDDRQYVNLIMGKNKSWEGAVADCRFDFIGNCGKDGENEFEFYYIAFFKGVEGAQTFGDAWLEKGSEALPTEAPKPTKAPTPVPTATPEPTEVPEATEVPATAQAETADPGQSGNTEKTEKTEKKNSTGLIIGIVAAVVVIAAAVTGILLGKKKKK